MFSLKRSPAPAPAQRADPATGVGQDALHFLSEHGLDHGPVNYALAWCVKAERRSMVAMAVDAILMEGRTLTQSDVDRIMAVEARLPVGSPDGAPGAADPRQDALRHQTLRLADLAAGAASQSSAFGRDLSTGLFHLTGGTQSVEQIVSAMVLRTRGVEEKLQAASREIEDLRQQVESTRDDAQRDALTGLPNRRGVLAELAKRRPGPGVVALCDVDHFKVVNDRYGHGVGDRVLKGVAASLAQSVGLHMVARWGGEEFLILLDGIAMDEAAPLLDRARTDLAARSFKLRATDEPLGTVTVSIGAAPLVGSTADDAIEAADRMLYAAKGAGRNRLATAPRGSPHEERTTSVQRGRPACRAGRIRPGTR